MPVVSIEELERLVAADRASGQTIAFANGVFDLLHVGHVRYLQAAADEADRRSSPSTPTPRCAA
jgi:bifunctional ADP-heptose synthase (sugar kinase/adenylyltransferase)